MASKKVNFEALKKAAAKRRASTEGRLFAAIKLIESGKPTHNKKETRLTPASVAREAEVGRDTVYRYPNVLEYIKHIKVERKTGIASHEQCGISDKESNYRKINKQLSIDKENLARDNNRLQVENEECKDRLQRQQQEIDELRAKLADKNKITSIRR